MKQVRCAICTRKSSKEGLEQDFNSLRAQREAYAASQVPLPGRNGAELRAFRRSGATVLCDGRLGGGAVSLIANCLRSAELSLDTAGLRP